MSSSPGTAPSSEVPSSTSGAPNRPPGSADAFSSLAADVPVEFAEGFAELGDVNLHYVEAGDGPLVVLLHGFPEFWTGSVSSSTSDSTVAVPITRPRSRPGLWKQPRVV